MYWYWYHEYVERQESNRVYYYYHYFSIKNLSSYIRNFFRNHFVICHLEYGLVYFAPPNDLIYYFI